MKRKKYPYEHRELADLRNEEWDDIPGLDGYFSISNYGRIRREEFETTYKDGRSFWRRPKIIAPTIISVKLKHIKEKISFLAGKATLNRRRYQFSIARLVYYLFIKKFNLNENLVVICKDTDNFNIRPKNLLLITQAAKAQRAVQRGRHTAGYLHLSENSIKKRAYTLAILNNKPVSQYSEKGDCIKSFPSLTAAEKATGIFASAIGAAASGKIIRAGGYVWRFGKKAGINFAAELKARKQALNRKNGQKVSQYNPSGKRIACYYSIEEAAEAVGTNKTLINMAAKGKYKSGKGYIWKKGWGPEQIDLRGYKWGKASMAITQSIPVEQYTVHGKLIRKFSSGKEAAMLLGVSRCSISDACLGRIKTLKGTILRKAARNKKMGPKTHFPNRKT